MADRVIQQVCVIPGTTPISAPMHFPLVFPAAKVDRIDVLVPPGPSGLMGFNIAHGGGNYLPDNEGSYIVADDHYFEWPTNDAPDNGNWDIVCYNNDAIQHTIWVYFHVSDLVVVSAPASGAILGL